MKKLARRAVRFKGLTLGLDVHKGFIEYCVLDKKGDEIRGGRIGSNEKELRKFLEELKKPGPVQASLEACGCFLWIYEVLVEVLGRGQAHVGQPSRIHVIGNSMEKNDANDAWWLAYLLYEGRLPESYVPEGELQNLRIASRELRSYTNMRGDLLRRFRAHLAQAGKSVPKNWHASKVKRDATKKIIAEVKGERRGALQALFEQVRKMARQMKHWRARVETLSKNLPEVKTLIEEMPGIGVVLGGAVVAELGSPKRFRSAKAYAKSTGLTPGYRESGGKSSGTKITRQGNAQARWAFTRAVVSCQRCKRGEGEQIKRWVAWRSKQKPKKLVIVAAARKLAEGVWRLFAYGEAFELAKAFRVKEEAKAKSA